MFLWPSRASTFQPKPYFRVLPSLSFTGVHICSTSKEQMWTPVKLNDGKTRKYGFGWNVDALEGHKNIGHGGSTSGFNASNQRFPDDRLAVIILTNTDEEIATKLAKKVATFFFRK